MNYAAGVQTLSPPPVAPPETAPAGVRVRLVERETRTRNHERRRYLAPVAALALAVVVTTANLGGWRSLGAHEGLAAVPARAMLNSGDWVVPDFGGVPRVKKPPLAYWLIAASGAVLGRVDEFAARLPSAVAGVLLCGLVMRWGWAWYGRRAGVAAAVCQATSFWFLTYARKAEVDVTLALLVTLGLWLAVGRRAGATRNRWAAVWAVAGVAWLGKFHFAPAVLFGPVVGWFVFSRRWRELGGLASPVGVTLFLLIAAPWCALLAARVPEAVGVWWLQTAGRAAGAFGTRGVGFYPKELVTFTLPWAPLWLWLAWRTLRRDGRTAVAAWRAAARRPARAAWRAVAPRDEARAWRGRRDRFPIVWLGVTLAALSVSAGKNRHYLLPALPACSLLAGRAAAAAVEFARRGRTFRGALRGRRAVRAAWAVPAAVGVAFVGAAYVVAETVDERAEAAAFVAGLHGRLPGFGLAGEPLTFFALGEHSGHWYARGATRRCESPAALEAALRDHGNAAVLTEPNALWRLHGLAADWRAAGGTLSIETLAACGGLPPRGGRRARYEPQRGLRLLRVTADRLPTIAVAGPTGSGIVRY